VTLRSYLFGMNNLRERERNKLERLDGEVDVVSFKEIGVD